MPSIHTNAETIEWEPGSPVYGQDAIYQGRELVQLKVMSDRRQEGGGIAYLVKFEPPPGKVMKIVAVAQSDEHIFSLEGGRSTKSGRQLRFDGQYALNPKGQPHSAFISVETTSLVVYSGEPDEIKSISVVDIEQAKQ